MSNKVKQIDLLNRPSLVLLAKKLQIKGYTNNFNSPYRNKDYLKKNILLTLKELRQSKRSNSVSSDTNFDNTAQINNNINRLIPATALKKSKSTGDISKLHSQAYSSINFNNINFEQPTCIFPPKRKIVAIGDIHGDLSVAIKALKLGKVIDARISDDTTDITQINWIGGDTFVVQLGDQIDRVRPSKLFNSLCTEDDSELFDDEGSDLKIICLFDRLNKQAQSKGGAVLSILGNHELMNVDGDFRYVSPKEFREFGNFFNGTFERNSDLPFGFKERKESFRPGGLIAKRLANNRYSVVQVGSWIFVHGGISPDCAKNYSLNDINLHIKKWLLGDNSINTMNHINNLYHSDDDDNSPFWTRIYSDMDEWDNIESIKLFNKTLNNLNVNNVNKTDYKIRGMIMGHSPQFMYDRGINSSANNRIWRVDVGASRAFGKINNTRECKHRLVQVLIIKNDSEFVIVKEKCSFF